MTKKDFIALADMISKFNADYINRSHYHESPPFTDDQLNALADFCQSQNPRFMRERWLDYIAGKCGPNGGSIRKVA